MARHDHFKLPLDKLMYLFKKCCVWRHSLKEMFFKGLNVFVQDLMRDAIVKKI